MLISGTVKKKNNDKYTLKVFRIPLEYANWEI